MKIQGLHFYPVKSCAGLSVPHLDLETEGPRLDREWMLVGEDGRFVTQRELPMLALLRPRLEKDALVFDWSGEEISVPLQPSSSSRTGRSVEIWGDLTAAWDEGDEIARWVSDRLGRALHLVRITDQARMKPGRRVRFPDSYPLHLCSLSSLEDVNRRLPSPVGIERFRPNIVIEGAPAWEEDTWRSLRVGDWEFTVAKACARCSITTIDPANAQKGVEPLKTLATFRRREAKVEFGQYLLSVAGARLEVGMSLIAQPTRAG